MPILAPPTFDPFSSRADRDIRNRLSSAFAEALQAGRPVFRDIAHELGHLATTDGARRFLEDRRTRYETVWPLAAVNWAGKGGEVFRLLWNHRLFFECHEILETRWHTAQGEAASVIQGLIQAAGVYVHLELGRKGPARKLAAKAIERLQTHREGLEAWTRPDPLLRALEVLDPNPPVLTEPVGCSR